MNDKEDYAGLIEQLNKWADPEIFEDSPIVDLLNRAASALTTLTQQNQQMRELLREWLNTELDSMDEEYQPWMDSFTARVKTLVGDMALPIVNGGASTTASGTHTPEPWPFWLRHHSYDRNVPEGWAYLPETDYERARVCVNACKGIPTEDLERWGISLIDKIREDEMHQARKVDRTAPETSTRSADE